MGKVAISGNSIGQMRVEDVYILKRELMNLKHYGSNLEDIFENIQYGRRARRELNTNTSHGFFSRISGAAGTVTTYVKKKFYSNSMEHEDQMKIDHLLLSK